MHLIFKQTVKLWFKRIEELLKLMRLQAARKEINQGKTAHRAAVSLSAFQAWLEPEKPFFCTADLPARSGSQVL